MTQLLAYIRCRPAQRWRVELRSFGASAERLLIPKLQAQPRRRLRLAYRKLQAEARNVLSLLFSRAPVTIKFRAFADR